MKLKKITPALTAAAIIGFTTGFTVSLWQIIANRYIQYKMFRLVFLSLQENLNKWVILAVIISIVLFFISELFTSLLGLNRKFFFANLPGANAAASFILLVILILNFGIVIDGKINTKKKPNIIIFLIDDLRKDRLGIYGYPLKTTPNIDRFSQEAVVFQNAFSQYPWSPASIASLFSSLCPPVHGIITRYAPRGELIDGELLDYKILTLAEILKGSGWTTGAFVGNHLLSKSFQFHQGFDVFDGINSKFKPLASDLNEKAFRWINNNKDKPFFAYLHYMDIHEPYQNWLYPYCSQVKPAENNNSYSHIDLYDASVRYVDYQIGQLLEKLKASGLFKNTIIVITSDHGEIFSQDGSSGEHGRTLYNDDINVPLIIKSPESVNLSDLKQQKVGLIDVMPTIIHILNLYSPYSFDGRDLLGTPNDILNNRAIFSMLKTGGDVKKGHIKIAMIKDNFKAIYTAEEQKVTELYDLDKDGFEKTNLIGIFPDKSKEFEKAIQSWQQEKLQERTNLGLKKLVFTIKDPKKIDELRSLGYLQ